MPFKNKTPAEIREYNRRKQAWHRACQKGLTNLTWAEFEKQTKQSLTENVKLFNSETFSVKPQSPKLWSDYYLVKKPTCPTCQQKGISATAYQFCSEELIAPREYRCVVKHFTVYQGKNFLR